LGHAPGPGIGGRRPGSPLARMWEEFPIFSLAAYDYELPRELIAQTPVEPRDQARMMVLWRRRECWEHRRFFELPTFLREGDVVVVNNSRVLPARLYGRLDRGGRTRLIEVLLLRPLPPEATGPERWQVLLRPGRRIRPGDVLRFPADVRASVVDRTPEGDWVLAFESPRPLRNMLDDIGWMPVPPYIVRRDPALAEQDRQWYQTVYAKVQGSIAAPTAGLHFTSRVIQALQDRGVRWCEITLHVGPGTFRPVRAPDIRCHRMDPEWYEIPPDVWDTLQDARRHGRRVLVVGTTTTRALESAAQHDPPRLSGWADVFIYPGYEFRVVRNLLTNFHLPKSTLLMLVCALGGYEFVLRAYREAVRERYRFYSYGDCMLILDE
jgi:S-adenosylmethionine:tRNA ribosyltransferase-isomerase